MEYKSFPSKRKPAAENAPAAHIHTTEWFPDRLRCPRWRDTPRQENRGRSWVGLVDASNARSPPFDHARLADRSTWPNPH